MKIPSDDKKKVELKTNPTYSSFNDTGVITGISSAPRASASYYNALPMPIRALLYIPVTAAQSIQKNVFPSILFTEGYHVFRQNFGFSRDKLINNLFLLGMIGCSASKFYINPWVNEEHEAIDAVWYQMGNKSICDQDYYGSFYASIWNFTKALGALVLTAVVNNILSSLLNGSIVFKRQYEFVEEFLSNYAAYGLNAGNKSSGTEADNEKSNLNPVKLLEDIENQNKLLALWNTRINTIIDCGIACYALFTASPLLVLTWYLGTIVLPRFLVLSVGYSLIFNTLLALFEMPIERVHQKLNQLKDVIIRQMTKIDHNAEVITFLDGEEFEEKKLLAMLNKRRDESIKHDLLDAGKDFFVQFFKNFEWVFPILASIELVRNGQMKQEEIGPYMHRFFAINKFLTWYKDNFEEISKIGESVRRLSLYNERLQAWSSKRVEIEKKVIDSNEISFSGSIFVDEKRETFLAEGNFTLEPSSITHFDAPSGSGKTTLFRIFRRVWGDFEGKCTLPKEKSLFLPSHVYVLDADEPLFQTVSYPINHESLSDHLELVKEWFKALELPERVYNNLKNLPLNADEATNKNIIFNWMMALSDGERKRVGFCNILLKLRTNAQKIDFLCIDEPFKGIGSKVQATIVKLLKDEISQFNPKCAVLFSNHELNHGLNTQTLTIDEQTKKFKLSRV